MSRISKLLQNKLLDIQPFIKEALLNNQPVVALESTIISHGMPYPQNVETAIMVENIVKKHGSIPATIALMNGKIKIGLSESDLTLLGKTGQEARKTSRRDFAEVLSQKLIGATTVSGTMIAAEKAGIKIFVTGGIGGVHRGAISSMDISADLTELGRTPVAVVCAGAKSILDIGLTLEYLETQGVSVTTLGETNDFPAFYFPKSGFQSPSHFTTHKQCAELISANANLNLNSGMVFAVPIPEENSPHFTVDNVEQEILRAIRESSYMGIKGKDTTPYLLEKLNEITGGESLKANIALIKNNAIAGSKIAVEFSKLNRNDMQDYSSTSNTDAQLTSNKSPMVIGATVIDLTSKVSLNIGCEKYKLSELLYTSTPGKTTKTLGGVGKNIAEACLKSGGNPFFFSLIGKDDVDYIRNHLKLTGFNCNLVKVSEGEHSSATYNSILGPDGSLICAVADMDINNKICGAEASQKISELKPNIVALDGNLTENCLKNCLETCFSSKIHVLFEPTSVPKSVKIVNAYSDLKAHKKNKIFLCTPNIFELKEMANAVKKASSGDSFDNMTVLDVVDDNKFSGFVSNDAKILILQLILKCGSHGVILFERIEKTENLAKGNSVRVKHYKPRKVLTECVSVNGAGDTMVGVILTGISNFLNVGEKIDFDRLIQSGMDASTLTLLSQLAVSEKLNRANIDCLADFQNQLKYNLNETQLESESINKLISILKQTLSTNKRPRTPHNTPENSDEEIDEKLKLKIRYKNCSKRSFKKLKLNTEE
ncbi:hypothetical protein HK099_007834 [Clydaea vesicula]|uniref:Carbohydrate kinase PfkB domain-containing protein n=1 Tax=Clydaea vesicula TaxID=447962 RepID=A0AAD5U812_9FUNG|nr:hypothetical protein HK099_007834 [Clydaea vesicula]